MAVLNGIVSVLPAPGVTVDTGHSWPTGINTLRSRTSASQAPKISMAFCLSVSRRQMRPCMPSTSTGSSKSTHTIFASLFLVWKEAAFPIWRVSTFCYAARCSAPRSRRAAASDQADWRTQEHPARGRAKVVGGLKHKCQGPANAPLMRRLGRLRSLFLRAAPLIKGLAAEAMLPAAAKKRIWRRCTILYWGRG
jgi:hypothetical protein